MSSAQLWCLVVACLLANWMAQTRPGAFWQGKRQEYHIAIHGWCVHSDGARGGNALRKVPGPTSGLIDKEAPFESAKCLGAQALRAARASRAAKAARCPG